MTETSNNYARVLYELSVRPDEVNETRQIFSKVPQIEEALQSPVVPFEEKERVIDRIFPDGMRNFLKVVCRHQKIGRIEEILDAYDVYCMKQKDALRAVLRYVTPPTGEQQEKIKAFLKKSFHVSEVLLESIEDKSLLGGFVLWAEGHEYDWSLQGRYRKLRQKLTRR